MPIQNNPRRLLSISIDNSIFRQDSAVRERMMGYAGDWDEMHIIVAADRTHTETCIAPNIWVYPTRSRIHALYPLDAIRLGKFVASRRNITHITCQDPFFTAMAGLAIRNSAVSVTKGSGISLEIQVHTDIGSPNYTHTIGNKVRKALALSYLPKADTIRVVSNRIRDYLVSTLGIAADTISVRPIAADTEAIIRSLILPTHDLHDKYPQFDKVVLMASRLTQEKNIDMALRAWPMVLAHIARSDGPVKHPGLIIVGDGPCAPGLRALAARTDPAHGSMVFEPWADRATLISYYKTADAFLTTSLYEGYGMTLVEAAAAGCPIVTTDVGVARELPAIIRSATATSPVIAPIIIGWTPEDAARGIITALGV